METCWLGECKIANCFAVIDTNVLLLIAEGLASFDSFYEVLEGCEPVIITPVLQELKKLVENASDKKSRLAKWVLENVISRLRIVEFNFQGAVDEALIAYAKNLRNQGFKVFVVSTDKKVREKALKEHIDIIIYKSSKRMFESL